MMEGFGSSIVAKFLSTKFKGTNCHGFRNMDSIRYCPGVQACWVKPGDLPGIVQGIGGEDDVIAGINDDQGPGSDVDGSTPLASEATSLGDDNPLDIPLGDT